jgi:hypothetical protein
MRKFVYLALVFLLTSLGHEAYSQMNRRSIKKNNRRISSYRGKKFGFGPEKRYNTIGLSLNALNYYGDLSPRSNRISTDITFTRPAIGVSFTHRFGPRYQLTAAFMYGTLKGSDQDSADPGDAESGAFRYVRNLSFRNRIKELSVVASFDLFENMATYISRVKWTPYAYAGLAVFHHNPQALAPATDLAGNPLPNGGEWVDLQPLGTEGQHSDQQEGDANYGNKPYKRIQPAIPFGIGARFRLNEVIDISAEIGFRYLFTDYIDDVSKDYVNLNKLDSELAKAMSYRSNELGDAPTEAVNMILSKTPRFDYGNFTTVPGYGQVNEGDSPEKFNKRGESSDRDIYMVTTIRVTYILGKTFHRAKFR